MKKQIYAISFLMAGIFLAFAFSVLGAIVFPDERLGGKPVKKVGALWTKTGNTIDVGISATTTQSTGRPINAYKVLEVGRDYLGQGGCLKLADADGTGFTYIIANNGQLSVSQLSCE